jgi:DNA polymerase-3 subunit alpha
VVECQVSEDDYSGGMRGRVKEIFTLQDFRQARARRLNIHLEARALNADFCDELATILAPYRIDASLKLVEARMDAGSGSQSNHQATEGGSGRRGCLIAARYRREDSEGCIIFGHQWTVAVSDDLLQRLKAEFGKQHISVQY